MLQHVQCAADCSLNKGLHKGILHSILQLLLLGVGFSTYSVYLHFDGRIKLQVLEFNVWGMPRQLGGQYKSLRIPKLAKKLREGLAQRKEYDIVLLSELWMKHDHEIIKQELVISYRLHSIYSCFVRQKVDSI